LSVPVLEPAGGRRASFGLRPFRPLQPPVPTALKPRRPPCLTPP
jgi:hypothetical protein